MHSDSDAAALTDTQWRQSLNGRKLFLGIDNMDSLAGIALKMLAFEQFLSSNPALHGKVTHLNGLFLSLCWLGGQTLGG